MAWSKATLLAATSVANTARAMLTLAQGCPLGPSGEPSCWDDYEERLRQRCGAGVQSRFCLPGTIQADYGLVARSDFDVRMGIIQRTPNRDLRRAANPADVRGAKHAFYGSTADFSETALAAFADAFLAGELTAHIRPDPRDEL